MKTNFRKILILFFIVILSGCANEIIEKEAENGVLDLSEVDFSKQIVQLNGKWEFYPNQFFSPADFKYSSIPLIPKYVTVPSKIPVLSDGTKFLDTGYATYRLFVKLPKAGVYEIDYDYLYTSAKIWVNNKLVYELGDISENSAQSKGVYSFGNFSCSIDSLDKDNFTEIIIQISNYKASRKFGITKSLTFGKLDVQSKRVGTSYIIYFILIGILFMIIFYHLVVFLFYPKNYSVLAFAFLTIVITIRSFFTNTIVFGPADYSFSIRVAYISTVLFVIMTMVFYHFFFKSLFKTIIVKIVLLFGVLLIIFYSFTPVLHLEIALPFLYLFIVAVNFYALFVLIKGSIKKVKGATMVVIAQSIFILSMINDMLFHMRVVGWGDISHYTVGIIALIEAVVIAKISANSFKENLFLNLRLDEQNKNLEQIVTNRTAELKTKNIELEKLSIIAKNSHNSIIVFDENFKIKWVNKSFEKLYGKDLEETIKKDNFETQIANNNLELTKVSLLNGRSVSFEKQIIDKQNIKKWVQTTLSPLYFNKQLSGIVAIESDITEIKKAQEESYIQNNKITSSLRYAKTIQRTILPSTNALKKYFDIFIINSPKDIVSGDFYFYHEITHSSLSFIITGIADCTGHGVPGAFMSLIINGLIDDVLLHREIYEPNDILRILNLEIKKILKQEESQNTDGAAIVLLKIVPMVGHYSITYSTANLSFIVYNSQENKLEKLRGNVNYIGGILTNKIVSFVSKKIKVNEGDIIYLQSDGITDQPNYKKKRYSQKQYFDTLLDIHKLPLKKQKVTILEKFTTWKGDVSQYDDILIYAIKFKQITLQK